MPPDTARRLTRTQAVACENAHNPRCRCRCQGAFHGARRTPDTATLPPDDPHSTLGQMLLDLTGRSGHA